MFGLTRQLVRVMKALREGGELYGQEISERDPAIPRGTVYNQLRTLEIMQLVDVRVEEGGRVRGVPRRYYRLNKAGQRLLRVVEKAYRDGPNTRRSRTSKDAEVGSAPRLSRSTRR